MFGATQLKLMHYHTVYSRGNKKSQKNIFLNKSAISGKATKYSDSPIKSLNQKEPRSSPAGPRIKGSRAMCERLESKKQSFI